jgi:hypothetical protein
MPVLLFRVDPPKPPEPSLILYATNNITPPITPPDPVAFPEAGIHRHKPLRIYIETAPTESLYSAGTDRLFPRPHSFVACP